MERKPEQSLSERLTSLQDRALISAQDPMRGAFIKELLELPFTELSGEELSIYKEIVSNTFRLLAEQAKENKDAGKDDWQLNYSLGRLQQRHNKLTGVHKDNERRVGGQEPRTSDGFGGTPFIRFEDETKQNERLTSDSPNVHDLPRPPKPIGVFPSGDVKPIPGDWRTRIHPIESARDIQDGDSEIESSNDDEKIPRETAPGYRETLGVLVEESFSAIKEKVRSVHGYLKGLLREKKGPAVAERADRLISQPISKEARYAVLGALGLGALAGSVGYLSQQRDTESREAQNARQERVATIPRPDSTSFPPSPIVESNSALTAARDTSDTIRRYESSRPQNEVHRQIVKEGDTVWGIMMDAVTSNSISMDEFWKAYGDFSDRNKGQMDSYVIKPGDEVRLARTSQGVVVEHVSKDQVDQETLNDRVIDIRDMKGPVVTGQQTHTERFSIPTPFISMDGRMFTFSSAPENLPTENSNIFTEHADELSEPVAQWFNSDLDSPLQPEESKHFKQGETVFLETRGGYKIPYRIISEIHPWTKGVMIEIDESAITDHSQKFRSAVLRSGTRRFVSLDSLSKKKQ